MPESAQEREKRHRQRTLFDSVADLYQASRPGYSPEMVEFVLATARLANQDAAVLEVGCGTGQLTQSLAGHGFDLTAIDIGQAMIAAARRQVPGVSFAAVSFEDLDRPPASYDLIISGAAFHWIDPEVKYAKSAALLRPGGWLALLGYRERYDDPLGATLEAMWAARGDTGGAWVQTAPDAGLGIHFKEPIHHDDALRVTRSPEDVAAVENTRALVLSWPEDERREFTRELRDHLRDDVHLSLYASVTMAQAR